MKGFRQLTDQSRINVKPDRIRIKRVKKAAPLRTALKSFGQPDDRLEELALMNGMDLTAIVGENSLIKTIGK